MSVVLSNFLIAMKLYNSKVERQSTTRQNHCNTFFGTQPKIWLMLKVFLGFDWGFKVSTFIPGKYEHKSGKYGIKFVLARLGVWVRSAMWNSVQLLCRKFNCIFLVVAFVFVVDHLAFVVWIVCILSKRIQSGKKVEIQSKVKWVTLATKVMWQQVFKKFFFYL